MNYSGKENLTDRKIREMSEIFWVRILIIANIKGSILHSAANFYIYQNIISG
jgi:hypothetical protein